MPFQDNIHHEPMTGCWLWGGARFHNGYGRTWHQGRSVLAHRCTNKACVNPEHLTPVTQLENHLLRMDRTNGGRDLCRNGHPFNRANTYVDRNGSRCCRICRNAAAQRYQGRR